MALDGIAIAHLVRELSAELVGGRIDKIHQPEKDELLLHIKQPLNTPSKQGSVVKNRMKNPEEPKGGIEIFDNSRGLFEDAIKKGVVHRLLISAGAEDSRVHITETVKENPQAAPLFCMVLRKHIGGGRVLGISQGDFLERIISFDIEAVNEMGEICRRRLVVEVMGKHSNVILLDGDTILDSIKRIGHDKSSVRQILPGIKYEMPPPQGKSDPIAALNDFEAFKVVIAGKSVSEAFSGISKATGAEIAALAEEPGDTERLYAAFCHIVGNAVKGETCPEMAENGQGAAVGFAPYKMTRYPLDLRRGFPSMSALLEEFYSNRSKVSRINQKSKDLRRFITLGIERVVRKHDAYLKAEKETENKERYRLYGELLTANFYRLKAGMSEVSLENYYDETGGEVIIPLNTRHSPQENAQYYFKRYNKEKRAAVALVEQKAQAAAELAYLESVLLSVQNAATEAELNEIREELADAGLMKRLSAKAKSKVKAKALPGPISHTSSDGFTILIGRNNRQNDELTMKTAAPADIWLHAKDIPGSHVIIKTLGGEVPNSTIEEAASLAAFHSKAAASSLVPVDYTKRKYVKKPTGSKPGMVIYTHQKTAFVRPKGELRRD